MKRYWQFLIVGVICLLAALLWAQPSHQQGQRSATSVAAPSSVHSAVQGPTASKPITAADPAGSNSKVKDKVDGDDPLPGSSSSLPLLAVIGFGVLAGGITSAMRTREITGVHEDEAGKAPSAKTGCGTLKSRIL